MELKQFIYEVSHAGLSEQGRIVQNPNKLEDQWILAEEQWGPLASAMHLQSFISRHIGSEGDANVTPSLARRVAAHAEWYLDNSIVLDDDDPYVTEKRIRLLQDQRVAVNRRAAELLKMFGGDLSDTIPIFSISAADRDRPLGDQSAGASVSEKEAKRA